MNDMDKSLPQLSAMLRIVEKNMNRGWEEDCFVDIKTSHLTQVIYVRVPSGS